MGCCVSKKRGEPPGAADGGKAVEARDLPPPEEEKVKEVLSETPRVKPPPRPRRVAGGAVVAPSAEKARAKDGGTARAKDGRGVGRPARSVEEKSEAASESSAATTVAGPERSPSSKPPRCRQGRPAPGGEPRRARRDRDHGAATPGGRGRASPSPPPPRRDPGRRSPSPAAKRAQDQRRDAAGSASCAQRKPPVPARPTPPRAQEAPAKPHLHGPPTQCASPPTPQAPEQEDTSTPQGSDGDAAAGDGEGEGKESLENPLVSMECFIFL
ncbi:proline-rich proteoglycan 2-like [Triticum dicoccoides]|uniref:proline-rich proteoglycan 2-like n=1 Tax=Triticum dicoccoides TaxID=85692 RepID=UPI00188E7607|nr:proline-rich proteoglycan 2-like [Triticum dicoccoides]